MPGYFANRHRGASIVRTRTGGMATGPIPAPGAPVMLFVDRGMLRPIEPVTDVFASFLFAATCPSSSSSGGGGGSGGSGSPGPTAVSATDNGHTTTITYSDGTVESRTGDRNYRTNNPGNMLTGPGKIGTAPKQGTTPATAIFPNYNTGVNAALGQLSRDAENPYTTVRDELTTWRGTSDGADAVARDAGLDPDAALSDLNGEQLEDLAKAIEKGESSQPPNQPPPNCS